jgi:sporulation protein YhbH
MAEIPWDLRRRALKDSLRHDARVKEAIRQHLKELIAEESIITAEGQKLVKLPLRYLDQYRFRFGPQGRGTGQGAGQVGEVIARERGEGLEQPGDHPGAQVYEAEISVDELTRLMLEDLALPWLEEKAAPSLPATTYTFDDIRRQGSMANLDKKRTVRENLKRHAAQHQPTVGAFHPDDLRFKVWHSREAPHTQAAVYLLMDRSGSMTTEKKYIAKSFFFWLVRFLRLKYTTVETIFIAHDTEAQIVPEQDFFTLSNSGGTLCSAAYRVALEHLQQTHPTARWNNYLFHFSDGDNWEADNPRCQALVTQLLAHTTMVGYGEIRYRDEASFYGWVPSFNPTWSTLHTELSTLVHPRFITIAIKQKEDVYLALQSFLGKKDAMRNTPT